MLINYYTKRNVDLKANLLSQCNLTKYGLSLLELELLSEKNNITLRSYECSWDELIKLNEKNPIIFILNKDGIFHYVIGIIKNKEIIIYDPTGEKYIIKSPSEFCDWSGYLCLTSYSRFRTNKINISLPLFKNFNLAINLCFLTINLFEFVASVFISWLMSKFMNIDYLTMKVDDLWKISFIYFIFVFINSTFEFINNYFKMQYYKKNYKYTILNFFNTLNMKKSHFYDSYNKQEMNQFFEMNLHLLNFYCFYWSDLISQILITSLAICFVLMINIKFILIIMFLLFVKSIFTFNYFNLDKKIQKTIITNQIKIENNLDDLLKFKISNQNYFKEIQWSENISKKLINLCNEKLLFDYKKSFYTLIYSVFENMLNFLLLVFLWQMKQFNLGILFLIISLFGLISNNFNNVLGSIKSIYQIKPIYKFCLIIFATNNITNKAKTEIDHPTIITWKNNKFKNNLLIETNNIVNHPIISSLLMHDDPLNEITINNQLLNNINEFDLKQKFILVDQNYSLKKEEVIKILNFIHSIHNKHDLLNINCINWDKFNFEKLNPDLKMVLILMSFLETKNSIICFNNFFLQCSELLTKYVVNLLKKINDNNFLITNNTTSYLMEYYDYQI